EAANEVVEAAAVAPVRAQLELRERPRPARDMELPGPLLGQPGCKAEVGEGRLPALERPVRAVRRLAAGDEVGELRAVVRAAGVAEPAPVQPPVLAPAARVVLLQPDLVGARA